MTQLSSNPEQLPGTPQEDEAWSEMERRQRQHATCSPEHATRALPPRTPREIAEALRELSERMVIVGDAMAYYGGFDGKMVRHGREMMGAAVLAAEWAGEIDPTGREENAVSHS